MVSGTRTASHCSVSATLRQTTSAGLQAGQNLELQAGVPGVLLRAVTHHGDAGGQGCTEERLGINPKNQCWARQFFSFVTATT